MGVQVVGGLPSAGAAASGAAVLDRLVLSGALQALQLPARLAWDAA